MNYEKRRLSLQNRALTFSGGTAEAVDCLNDLVFDTKVAIQSLNDLRQNLLNIQLEFFTEIKSVADKVGIKMPEPSEIELLNIVNPTATIKNILKNKNSN